MSEQMKTIPLSRKRLEDIVKKQDGWGYNRQLEPTYLKEPRSKVSHKLITTMPHKHKFGEPCEEHLRTLLTTDDKMIIAFIDMPYAYWDTLVSESKYATTSKVK